MKKLYVLIGLVLLFSCEAQESLAPVTPPPVKMAPSLRAATLKQVVPLRMQKYVIDFNDDIYLVPDELIKPNDLREIRVKADEFQANVAASDLVEPDKQYLYQLADGVRVTSYWLEAEGMPEIRAALANDLVTYGWLSPDEPSVIEARQSGSGGGCNVDVRNVMLGAVVGFFSGAATGGYAGATVGTFVCPVVGSVTGMVSGGIAGGAVGFFTSTVAGVAAELLGSCFTRRHREVEWDGFWGSYKDLDDADKSLIMMRLIEQGPDIANAIGLEGPL